MRAAFVVARQPWYQLMAPVIDAALARGWDVECWHDYSQPSDGPKGYQFPAREAVPAFACGRPHVRVYEHRQVLESWLAEKAVDAVISIRTPQLPLPDPSDRPITVELQHVSDTFVGLSPEEIRHCDVVALYSRWWQQWGCGYYEAQALIHDGDGFADALATRAIDAGMPALDAAASIDPDEVRRRWGLSPDRPVVALFPFPQGIGRTAFWPRKIYGESRRWRQLAHVVAEGEYRYLRDVWQGWNDRRVVQAIRRFCDAQGAALVVKSRRKTPIPPYLAEIADVCLYDESWYPASILEVLRISQLAISHFSSSVLEAAAMGVPHLCIPFTAEHYGAHSAHDRNAFSRFFHTEEGGPFRYAGVSTVLEIPDVITQLPQRTLASFASDPQARDRYVRQYLSSVGGAGDRIVSAVERVHMNRTFEAQA